MSLRERLAELEHEQWQYWRKALENKFPELPKSRYTNVRYEHLPEIVKNQDRIWARKVMRLIREFEVKK